MSVPLSELSDITVKEEVLYDVSTHHDDYPTFLQADNGVNVGLVHNIKAEDDYNNYTTQPFTGWRTKVPAADIPPAVSHIAQSTHSVASDYACRQCGKKFYVKLALMVHEQSHISEAINSGSICPHANVGISTVTSVAGSSSQVKSEESDEHSTCQETKCIKAKVGSNNAHEATPMLEQNDTMIDTGERPHVCDICGESFIRRIDFSIHKWSHGEKPYTYKCETCQKIFASANNLKVHHRIHTGVRPYGCTFCGRRFTESGSLKIHHRTHTGERPYACEFCDKLFIKSSNVKVHIRKHTGSQPYMCIVCKASFSTKADMVSHKEIGH